MIPTEPKHQHFLKDIQEMKKENLNVKDDVDGKLLTQLNKRERRELC